jgi:hypothetical protein
MMNLREAVADMIQQPGAPVSSPSSSKMAGRLSM